MSRQKNKQDSKDICSWSFNLNGGKLQHAKCFTEQPASHVANKEYFEFYLPGRNIAKATCSFEYRFPVVEDGERLADALLYKDYFELSGQALRELCIHLEVYPFIEFEGYPDPLFGEASSNREEGYWFDFPYCTGFIWIEYSDNSNVQLSLGVMNLVEVDYKGLEKAQSFKRRSLWPRSQDFVHQLYNLHINPENKR